MNIINLTALLSVIFIYYANCCDKDCCDSCSQKKCDQSNVTENEFKKDSLKVGLQLKAQIFNVLNDTSQENLYAPVLKWKYFSKFKQDEKRMSQDDQNENISLTNSVQTESCRSVYNNDIDLLLLPPLKMKNSWSIRSQGKRPTGRQEKRNDI